MLLHLYSPELWFTFAYSHLIYNSSLSQLKLKSGWACIENTAVWLRLASRRTGGGTYPLEPSRGLNLGILHRSIHRPISEPDHQEDAPLQSLLALVIHLDGTGETVQTGPCDSLSLQAE